MVVGASAHVFYQLDSVYPTWAEPLFGAPAVYVTTFVALGGTWAFFAFVNTCTPDRDRPVARWLALTGIGILLGLFAYAAAADAFAGAEPFWPGVSILVAIPVTLGLYFGIAYVATDVVARARLLGGLVLFAHALDGITTAIGIDVIGTTERSPLPAAIMDLAGRLPVADTVGVGWLFVLVKLAVAVLIVYAFAEYLETDPVRGNLGFAAVVALGLGPAVNNLLLFTLREHAALASVAG